MTPQILRSLQAIRRELGAEEITVVCNDRGVEMRAGDDLLFVDMLPEAAKVEPTPAPELEAPPARTPWPTSADRCTCGWGGVHDPDNARCARWRPA